MSSPGLPQGAKRCPNPQESEDDPQESCVTDFSMAQRSQSSTHDLSGGSCPLPTMRMVPQQRGLLRGRGSCCRAFIAWSRRKALLSPSPAVMGCCSQWDEDAPNWQRGVQLPAQLGTRALISQGIDCIHSASSLRFIWGHLVLVKALELWAGQR